MREENFSRFLFVIVCFWRMQLDFGLKYPLGVNTQEIGFIEHKFELCRTISFYFSRGGHTNWFNFFCWTYFVFSIRHTVLLNFISPIYCFLRNLRSIFQYNPSHLASNATPQHRFFFTSIGRSFCSPGKNDNKFEEFRRVTQNQHYANFAAPLLTPNLPATPVPMHHHQGTSSFHSSVPNSPPFTLRLRLAVCPHLCRCDHLL